MPLFDYLLVDTVWQGFVIVVIVFIASIVRGCIGFGLSALIVASTYFWLDAKSIVFVAMILEFIASVFMIRDVRSDVHFRLFAIISISGVITGFTGIWALSNSSASTYQMLVSCYLLVVVLTVLSGFSFSKPMNDTRMYLTGSVAGFYNGFAAMGGIFLTAMLTSSRVNVGAIRATMTAYFFPVASALLASAWMNGLLTVAVLLSTLLLTLPMLLGIYAGSRLFDRLPEDKLKRLVLIALLLLSVVGLVKTLL